jgi:hypothetical protein
VSELADFSASMLSEHSDETASRQKLGSKLG